MATSGSYDFTSTRNELIDDTFRKLGIIAEGEVATSEMVTRAARDLNIMIKGWMAKGLNLWRYETLTLFPIVGRSKYLLGTTGDRCAANAVVTKLSADAVTGASSITVDDAGTAASVDNIGVVLDDGTIQWTTINGAPSGNTITLTDVLTSDAADDNPVYIYTTLAQRPLRITTAQSVDSNNNELTLYEISRSDYDKLTYKTNQGTPSQYHYTPTLGNGEFYVWVTFSDVKSTIRLTVQRPIQDFDILTDNPDLPVEWQEAIVWNLAKRLITEYGVVDQVTITEIKQNAFDFLEDAESFDQETASLQFIPESYDAPY